MALPTWKREPRQIREEATVAWKRVAGPSLFKSGPACRLEVSDFTFRDPSVCSEQVGLSDFTFRGPSVRSGPVGLSDFTFRGPSVRSGPVGLSDFTFRDPCVRSGQVGEGRLK